MNTEDIQKILDLPNAVGAVKLPPGEFEGPFTVNRPCIINGNDTTLWCREGTVLDIRSKGVTLKDIRAEITGGSDGTAISCRASDTVFENVSVCGNISGLPGEDGVWAIPRVITAGNISPGTPFVMLAEVYVPVPAEIIVNISGITAEPSRLSPGMNTVKLTAEPLTEGTVIYGDMIFRSAFIRRAYVTLSVSSAGTSAQSGQYFYRASEEMAAQPAPAPVPKRTAAPAPQINIAAAQPARTPEAAPSNGIIKLIRGQRANVLDMFGDSEITAELKYSSSDRPLDIDGYAFLLNSAGIAESDRSLVFFGNDSGAGGAVSYIDGGDRRYFRLELDRVPENIAKIAVAFSIYGDDPAENFSRLHQAALILKSAGKTAGFPMEGFFREKTIVAAEFYRKNDSWRMSAVGQGYANGLRRLCESFGLTIL